jgi:hypothetical protein
MNEDSDLIKEATKIANFVALDEELIKEYKKELNSKYKLFNLYLTEDEHLLISNITDLLEIAKQNIKNVNIYELSKIIIFSINQLGFKIIKDEMYKLYLDDIRIPKNKSNWIIARSYNEAIIIVNKFGCPNYISFDHDLGTDKSGLDFVKWLIEKDLDNPGFIPDNFKFNVHSANPVGKENIEGLLNDYMNKRKQNL